MFHRNRRVLASAACAAILAGTAGFAWQDRDAQASVQARGRMREAAAVTRPATRIVGTVWTAENTPIAMARLRLRNATTGRIEATVVANDAGQFVIPGIEGGPFVVEYLSSDDRVLAVGNAFIVAPGETVATFIRLGANKPWYVGFFSNAATAVVSGAAATGITAFAPVQRRASPDRPQ
jgi:hypothetical protein